MVSQSEGVRGPNHPPPARGTATRTPPLRWLWMGLIGLLVAVELLFTLSDAGVLGSQRWRAWAYEYGALWAGLLRGWTPNFTAQPVTMFGSYAFLHTGWMHLSGNVLALVWLGLKLEQSYDARRFLSIYALAALGAALAFAYWPGGSLQPMVGASGAIMGMVAVWVVQELRALRQRGARRARLFGQVALYAGVIVAVHLAERLLSAGQMAWEAHLGGALTGFAAMALVPALRPA